MRSSRKGVAEPKLSASWFPAAGAVYYLADVSYDAGASWEQVYEGQGNQFSAVVTLAALTLRVQAVNGTIKGPFSSVSIEAPTIVIADRTVALQSLIDGLQYQVTTLQDKAERRAQPGHAADRGGSHPTRARATGSTRNSCARNCSRRPATPRPRSRKSSKRWSTTRSAFAEFQTNVSATFGPAFSSVSTVSDAVATLDGYAAAAWSVTVTANGAVAGIELVNGGAGTSAFVMAADHVQIQLPGFNGDTPMPCSRPAWSAGVPSVGINGNLILNGTITATMMNVGSLSAISVNAGAIKAGTLTILQGRTC